MIVCAVGDNTKKKPAQGFKYTLVKQYIEANDNALITINVIIIILNI